LRLRAFLALLASSAFVACGLDIVGQLVPVDAAADASDAGRGDASSPPTHDDSGIVDGGVVDAEADAGPCGSMVTVTREAGSSYCIDPTEVTEARYGKFLAEDASITLPAPCANKGSFRPGSTRGASRPVAEVDWCDAWAFCSWAGKRLCGPEEWQHACNAGSGTAYPYGDTFDASVCNGGGSRTESVDVGSLPGCHGPIPGLFDMSGNADEWSEGCLTDVSLFDGCPTRGGDWSNDPAGELTCTSTQYRIRGSVADFVGFRCCKSASP
jgi:formylglycine-generating enzyme required for sulfatase activity